MLGCEQNLTIKEDDPETQASMAAEYEILGRLRKGKLTEEEREAIRNSWRQFYRLQDRPR